MTAQTTTTCKSCGADIVWVVNETTGSHMPIDVDPVPGGNLAVVVSVGDVPRTVTIVEGDPTVDGYVSHFVTCPDADDWRGKGKGKGRSKVDHVRNADQTRRHTCHWPGCNRQVPPAKWGCRKHWFKLPAALRRRVWDTYVPGQEETLTPSDEYIAVAREVQDWIAANHPEQGTLL